MSFDRLAPYYRGMERLLAGNKLHRCRTAWLEEVRDAKRILLAGEGHGRFLEVCAREFPQATIVCVDASREETLAIAEAYAVAGVTEIVALRGDAPKGAERFVAQPDGFASSVELVEALADTGKFTLRVGAYPEAHPDSADTLAGVRYLKRKLDAGATSAITQFFFEAETFLRFRDLCEKQGITAPIIPGILPITSWAGAKRFAGPRFRSKKLPSLSRRTTV